MTELSIQVQAGREDDRAFATALHIPHQQTLRRAILIRPAMSIITKPANVATGR